MKDTAVSVTCISQLCFYRVRRHSQDTNPCPLVPCPVSWCLGQVSLSQSEARDDGQWPMRSLLCSSLVLWWHHQHWRWDTQSAAAVLLLLGAVGSGAARPPLLLVLLSVLCDPLRCQHHHHHTSDHPSWLVTLVTWHEPVWRTCHVPRDRHVTRDSHAARGRWGPPTLT